MTKTRKKKQPRSAGNNGRTKRQCNGCPSACCHDLAIVMTRPRTRDDIDYYKWHLHYDAVSIAIRNRRWHLVVKGRCIYLDAADLCTIYDRRPEKCRRHNPPDCERFGSWHDTLLETPEQLEDFVGRKKRKEK